MPNEAAENKDVLHPLEDHHNDIAHHDDRKISKRIRWATQKHPEASGEHKRHAILRRISQRKANHEKSLSNTSTTSKPDGQPQQNDNEGPGRRIFFNLTLPDNARDEHGRPISHYPRNKIRTAKYTPISFVPKNLWFQFQNIANIYFLFIIILGFFAIFGVTNPGLNAVPLIVIVFITAVKDAIEDWRRTTVDDELNNAPIHRLVDWENVNTAEEKVSFWRRFKKANSRASRQMWIGLKKLFQRKRKDGDDVVQGKSFAERAVDMPRPSIETRQESIYSPRLSSQSYREDSRGFEMTPVITPNNPSHYRRSTEINPMDRAMVRSSVERSTMPKTTPSELQVPTNTAIKGQGAIKEQKNGDGQDIIKRNYGSLINPQKVASGKPRFIRDCWKNVQVGDFIRLYNNEQIPADVVIISTSDHDGVCYVETKNLDGETNLKVRNALHCGAKIRSSRHCEKTEFVIESEPAHANLYAYNGVIRWENYDSKHPDQPPQEMAEPIGINNVLLRGCSVRNTQWVLAVVIFTGEESKIMLNSGITPSKRAKISKSLNWNVLYNFIILFCMCLVAGIVQGTNYARGDQSLNFFEYGSYGGTPALNGFINFWAAVILFQNLVPISLYISLEVVRTAQAFFIYSDVNMYYAKLDYPCTPKSWNLSDDLGQIEYIFSDKTGTLTQNVMEFKKATINGIAYGEAYTEALAGMQKRQGIDTDTEGAKARAQIATDKIKMMTLLRQMHDNQYLHQEDLTFVAPELIQDLQGNRESEQKSANEEFMLALALCHTVISERLPGDLPKIDFKAQSPDEAALVATAKDCGWTVLPTHGDDKLLNIQGNEVKFHVMNTLEFNSARKRMSIIIRMPDNKIMLYCKGADSIIYSRLKQGEQPELRRKTAEHLEMFAREGLRTLCIAQKQLSEEEYQTWHKDHQVAAASLQNREEKIEETSDRIERDLTLLGGTAIEDRLQDGVPDSIALLGLAGIKLWVLTGDKVETAINIGFSCNLLSNDMDLIQIKIEDQDMSRAEAEVDRHLATFGKTGSDEELRIARNNHEPPQPTHALVIDGDSLRLMLDERLRQKFLLLCKECKSVLCCRVSPAQKAAVVAMVKNGLDVITLSIGDGANDVSMIQEAHVGVGIAGEEGRQAVMSSDYAIGQFRYLTRLLLVHGRWSYRRLAETISNFFYKNLVWVFAIFWFNIYDNFDCSYVFDYTYILCFNLFFTSAPVVFLGILDQDVSDKVSLAVPQLYRRGIERKEWTQLKFWLYMLDALYQSVICFFMPYLLFHTATFATPHGQNINDFKNVGVYIATAIVIVVNLYVVINTYRWDWLFGLLVAISILFIFAWTGIYTSFTAANFFYGAAKNCYSSPSFWAITALTVVMCLLPRLTIKAIQKIYFPRDVDIIREEVRQGKYKYLDEPLHSKDDASHDGNIQATEKDVESASSSEVSKGPDRQVKNKRNTEDDDRRPIYPPSVTGTAKTHQYHPSIPNSENTIDYGPTMRDSLDRTYPYSVRPHTSHARPLSSISMGNVPTTRPLSTNLYRSQTATTSRSSEVPPRVSLEWQNRKSFEFSPLRASFEGVREFTSAAHLSRVESLHAKTDKERDSNLWKDYKTYSRKDGHYDYGHGR